jgi:hypothetical protein
MSVLRTKTKNTELNTELNTATLTRKQLAELYSISIKTLNRKIKSIPGYDYKPGIRIFFPRDIEVIFNYLGKPSQLK